jgi:hypothetical protein
VPRRLGDALFELGERLLVVNRGDDAVDHGFLEGELHGHDDGRERLPSGLFPRDGDERLPDRSHDHTQRPDLVLPRGKRQAHGQLREQLQMVGRRDHAVDRCDYVGYVHRYDHRRERL